MLVHLGLLIFPVHVICGHVPQHRGVAPELRSRYTPSSSSPPTWQCLDDTHVIPWAAVNDDYCDCPDGSDEPGTSACPEASFYCINEGHIGSRIPSSRVDDGLCEPECCDGSDEPSGVCPNICKEVGKAYAQKMEAERKLRKKGAKIRSTYIAFAQKEKKRLEDSIALLEKEVPVQEKEVEQLKNVMDRSESLSATSLEVKKQSPLYQSLLVHHNALKSLRKAHLKHLEKEKQLEDILDALKGGYNPNYQDMAVLEAVRGWEALSGDKNEESAESTDSPELEEGEWTEDQLKYQLEGVINEDHVALLLGHDSYINKESTSMLWDLSLYLPESLTPQYNWLCNAVVEWLRTFGVIRGPGVTTNTDGTSQARAAYNEAESKFNAAKDNLRDEQDELAELFDPQGFGIQGEWKKLQGLCLSKDTGEYTYEVCLFGAATQKSGAHHNLGSFSSWSTDPNIEPGEPRYYEIQHYTGGAQCWNGPQRSVTLHLSCGTENQILTIEEPEKCEYHLTATTPALCLPLEAVGNTREEL
ncbi:glucosidase II beta subunit-like-domain-containing protein [Gautieria morchelliformis]|nr:glucosidase II beta subunit-like-domain-containing protein [Gautieria morchelliformis]